MTRTVVVTGGGTGIGKAVAAVFAAEGARVLITGRRADVLHETATSLGENVDTFVCDATDLDQVEELRHHLLDPVDVLVNNAGGAVDFFAPPPSDDLPTIAAHWQGNLSANLMSAVLTTAALDKQLGSGGAVIHIGSFASERGQGAYGAAKAALGSWNIFLARRLGPRSITANVVAPGYIEGTEFFGSRIPPQFYQTRVAETMTGRAGHPDDVASVVHFLASPSARHITGQVIPVNGGALTTR